MQKALNVFIFSFLVILTACHKKAIVQSDNKTNLTTSTTSTLTTTKSVIIEPNMSMADTGAAYHLDHVMIDNNILSIFVNYSGGCKTHSFDLFSNGAYAKSLPPQVSVYLKHTNNGDGCRQWISEELKFDVSKLKYSGQKIVIINIGNTQRVNYIIK